MSAEFTPAVVAIALSVMSSVSPSLMSLLAASSKSSLAFEVLRSDGAGIASMAVGGACFNGGVSNRSEFANWMQSYRPKYQLHRESFL